MNKPRATAVLLLAVLLSAVSVEIHAGEDTTRCPGEATTCAQQIRKMLSKKRYLGVALENTDWGTVVRRVEGKSPAEGAGLVPTPCRAPPAPWTATDLAGRVR